MQSSEGHIPNANKGYSKGKIVRNPCVNNKNQKYCCNYQT